LRAALYKRKERNSSMAIEKANLRVPTGVCFTGLKIVVMGLLLSVGWSPATSGAGECPDLQGENETTNIGQMNIGAGGKIPAIDAAIPETTKTATFAMG
jgi:hypothetical protein